MCGRGRGKGGGRGVLVAAGPGCAASTAAASVKASRIAEVGGDSVNDESSGPLLLLTCSRSCSAPAPLLLCSCCILLPLLCSWLSPLRAAAPAAASVSRSNRGTSSSGRVHGQVSLFTSYTHTSPGCVCNVNTVFVFVF